jgi:DNA polymerase-3 subunit delta'
MMLDAYPWQIETAQRLLSLRRQLPHALLLHGRAGLGKHALAQSYAKFLLCESADKTSKACGTCSACHWFEQGAHPDIHILQPSAMDETEDSDAKKSAWISVEQVRHAIDFVQLTSHRNGLRIVLIYPAEAMQASAANALLKTLEEPPENSLLILVTDQASKLIPTILSRCHLVGFDLPDNAAATIWLQEQGVKDAALCLALAAGSPLQAMALADAEFQSRRRALLQDLLAAKQTNALQLAERYAKLDNADFSQLVLWLQQWAHDILAIKLAGRVYYHLDYTEQLHSLTLRVKLNLLQLWQQRLQQARAAVAHPLNVQMVLEDILLDYVNLFE